MKICRKCTRERMLLSHRLPHVRLGERWGNEAFCLLLSRACLVSHFSDMRRQDKKGRREMGESDKASIMAAASEVSHEFQTLIDAEAVESLKQTQDLILGRLQDSNAVLSHFNEYSENCFADVLADFSRNTRLLKSMKADLDHIFLKLRSMKARILATYPDAFPEGPSEVLDSRPDLEMPTGGWTRQHHQNSDVSPGQSTV